MGVDSRQSRKLLIRRILAIAALGAVPCAVTTARGDTAAEWQSTLGGTWNSGINWSTNPNFPNNGTPAGTNYQANFDLTAASNYTVSTSGIATLAVDAINITSANAVLQQNSTTLTVGGINMTAGTYQFRSGTLSGAAPGSTVSIAPTATFQLSGGTLNQLTFTGSNVGCVSASKTITITNGLNLSGYTLNAVQNTLVFDFDGASQTLDQIVLNCATPTTTKSPILNVGGPTSGGVVTTTLGTGATVEGAATFQDNPSIAGDTLLNNGTVDANTSGQTFTINTSNFTNAATVEATAGGTLVISSANWSNSAGTIAASGASVVQLGGIVKGANLGTVNCAADSTVEVTGTVNNSSNTLSLGTIGAITLAQAGVISGGSIRGPGTRPLLLGGGTLSNIAVDTDVSLAAGMGISSLQFVNITGGLTSNGGRLQLLGANTDIDFTDASEQISNINIVANAPASTNFQQIIVGFANGSTASTVTLAYNATILVHVGRLDLQGNGPTPSFINNGIITATSTRATFQTTLPPAITNNGTIQATQGATLSLLDNNAFNNYGLVSGNAATVSLGGNLINRPGATISVSNGTQLNINVANGGTDGSSFQNYGTLTANNSVVTIDSVPWINAPGATINIQNAATLSMLFIPTSNEGSIIFSSAGLLNVPSGKTLQMDQGTLGGSGTINGPVSLTTASTMEFQLGGTTKGITYDSLNTGPMSLSGNLQLAFDSNFQNSITPAETFTVLTATALSGSFLNVPNGGRLTTTDGFGSFQVNYGAGLFTNEIVLSNFQSLPEPTTASLLAAAAIIFIRRPKRRRA